MWKMSAEQKDEAVSRYATGESSSAIAATYGVSGAAVRKLLGRRGVTLRSRSEAATKYSLSHEAFDVLTPESEYWCGFLAADGTIVSRGGRAPEVAVVLARRDRSHLESFRSFLGAGHAITEVPPGATSYPGSTGAFRLSVRSGRIAKRLNDLGVKQGLLAPALAASRHFWRGVVDGDGYIGISGGHAQFKVVGEERLLSHFRDFLASDGVATGLNVRPHKGIYVVGASRGGAERVVRHLYSDAPTALSRKADAARNILKAAGAAVSACGDFGATRSVKQELPGPREAVPVQPAPPLVGIPRL